MEMTAACALCGAPTKPPRTVAEPSRASAGARLLDYLGLGVELAVVPGGFLVAVQADHLVETVRLGDLEGGGCVRA